MNRQRTEEEQRLHSSQSADALLARLRPQNDNLTHAASTATLNTLRPRALLGSSVSIQSLHGETAQAKVARLRGEAGTNLNQTISNSTSALQLSTNQDVRAPPMPPHLIVATGMMEEKSGSVAETSAGGIVVALSPPHNLANNKTATRGNNDLLLPGGVNLRNSFISSLAMTPQQMHDLFKVPHTFYYLRMKEDGSSVYELELVNLDQVDKNAYFTLSKEGVTQFRNKQSSFTSLTQWERECRLFNKIADINFFRVYKRWKAFTVWKKDIRYGKMASAAERVEATLFVFNPPLRKALLNVRTMTMPLTKMGMLALPEKDTFDFLENFVRAQAAVHDDLRFKLRQLSANVLASVRSACDEVVDQFLKVNNIAANHKMTFMERAALRSECKKLTRFLRMMDICMSDFLKTMVHDAMLRLVEAVESASLEPRTESSDDIDRVKLQRKREANNLRTPLFRLIASFRRHPHGQGNSITSLAELSVEDAIQLSPNFDSLIRALDGVVNDCLEVIGSFVKVLSAPDTEMYVMPSGDDDEADSAEPEDMLTTIRNGPTYVTCKEAINTHIRAAYGSVKEYLNIFEPYRQLYLKNLTNVVDIPALFPTGEMEVFQNTITEYREQIELFSQVPRYSDLGVMFVDSADLKLAMIPSPVDCLNGIKGYLPLLITEKAQELSQLIGGMNPVLAGEPTTVEAYVNKKKVKDIATAGLEEYNNRQSYIRSLVNVMDDNLWQVPDDVKALMRMLKDSLIALEANIQLAEGREEEETKKFSVQVTDECPKVLKKLTEVREQLDNAQIADPDAIDEKVVKFLAQQEIDFARLKSRVEKLQEYQTILRLPVDDFEIIEEVGSDLNLKIRLWNDRVEWTKLRTKIMEQPMSSLDVTMLERELAKYNKTVAMTSKGLPMNKVVPKLKQSVDEVNPVLPIITDLRNPCLQSRHWEQITKLVGFNILEQEDFSMADLISKGVTKFQEEIAAIATSAQQESILEEMMLKVTGIWEKLVFEVKPYKDTKGRPSFFFLLALFACTERICLHKKLVVMIQ